MKKVLNPGERSISLRGTAAFLKVGYGNSNAISAVKAMEHFCVFLISVVLSAFTFLCFCNFKSIAVKLYLPPTVLALPTS